MSNLQFPTDEITKSCFQISATFLKQLIQLFNGTMHNK